MAPLVCLWCGAVAALRAAGCAPSTQTVNPCTSKTNSCLVWGSEREDNKKKKERKKRKKERQTVRKKERERKERKRKKEENGKRVKQKHWGNT